MKREKGLVFWGACVTALLVLMAVVVKVFTDMLMMQNKRIEFNDQQCMIYKSVIEETSRERDEYKQLLLDAQKNCQRKSGDIAGLEEERDRYRKLFADLQVEIAAAQKKLDAAMGEDRGLGYQPGMDKMDGMDGVDKPGVESPKEAYEKPMFLEMALNPRLNKVLASGKMFLIVTETEPYYLDVYRMIRHQEQTQGTWTGSDEQGYVEALEDTRNWIPALTTPPANKLAFGDPSAGTTVRRAGTTKKGGTATARTVKALQASNGTMKR